ncbi:hypothetical protein PI125_g473 [Phytophthora idaei]|nr:hypothetical protein PI125_g473 [Phytophthora idaei]
MLIRENNRSRWATTPLIASKKPMNDLRMMIDPPPTSKHPDGADAVSDAPNRGLHCARCRRDGVLPV